MSALILILPGLQAAASAHPRRMPLLPCQPHARKAPHRLTLVQATGEPSRTVQPMPVRVAPSPELAFYRKYTEALLRRYLRLALDAGRVPSLLGREILRGDVSHARARSFEDAVIFVLDVERCIEQITPGRRHLLRRIALQQYTQGETAAMLGMSLRTVIRRYNEALDQMTRLLLARKLLLSPSQEPEGEVADVENSCQPPSTQRQEVSHTRHAV